MAYSNQASTTVYDFIVEQIRNGTWVPGMKIFTEEQFCSELGVSRVAVRQAVERLAALSVLKKIQGSGTYVNSFEDCSLAGMVFFPATIDRFITVLEFRKRFDAYNCELYVENATEEELAKLKENYEAMIKVEDNPELFHTFENDFHQMIAEGTHNAIIRQICIMMNELLAHYQELQYDNIGPENSIIWHGRILEALEAKDGEMAKLCCRVHLENSLRYIKEQPPESVHLK
jgi:GntR family transcriptional repressor for pyruvate dehydrogenase complex